MRFLFTILFLLAFPTLVLLYRQHFLDHVQRDLTREVNGALKDPEFAGVKPELNYVDVSLRGMVASLDFREEARRVVDAVPGVRCRETDNHLLVKAQILGTLEGSRLTLSGWLHHASALSELVTWLDESRPGMEIESAGVHFSPHVMVPPVPVPGAVPEPLQELWPRLQVPASLQLDRDRVAFRVKGELPSLAMRQAVVSALPATTKASQPPAETSELKAGAYVPPAPFADEEALPAFIAVFFASPGAVSFSASGSEMVIKGDATPATRTQWLAALGKFPQQVKVKTDFQVYPSVYHFASYAPESALPHDEIESLREALKTVVISFGPASTIAAPTEVGALDQVAEAILTAGPAARILVCGLYDANEGATYARRRVESVKGELIGRGVLEGSLENLVIQSILESGGGGRRVEFLIK